MDPKLLNSMVSSAKGLEELLSLAEKYGLGFDAIHVSTCLNRYGRVWGLCFQKVAASVDRPVWPMTWHARDDIRLSKLDERDHGRIRADPRFLKLVRLAEAKLKGRPRELGEHAVANMLNGEWMTPSLVSTSAAES
jgi:hypothetical protein